MVSRFGLTSNNNKPDSPLNRSNGASNKEESKDGGVVHHISSLFKKKDKHNYIPSPAI